MLLRNLTAVMTGCALFLNSCDNQEAAPGSDAVEVAATADELSETEQNIETLVSELGSCSFEESEFETSAKISGSAIVVSLSKIWLEESSEEDWIFEFDIMDIAHIALSRETNDIQVECANGERCVAITLPQVYAEFFNTEESSYEFTNCSGSADAGLPLVRALILWKSYYDNDVIDG